MSLLISMSRLALKFLCQTFIETLGLLGKIRFLVVLLLEVAVGNCR